MFSCQLSRLYTRSRQALLSRALINNNFTHTLSITGDHLGVMCVSLKDVSFSVFLTKGLCVISHSHFTASQPTSVLRNVHKILLASPCLRSSVGQSVCNQYVTLVFWIRAPVATWALINLTLTVTALEPTSVLKMCIKSDSLHLPSQLSRLEGL